LRKALKSALGASLGAFTAVLGGLFLAALTLMVAPVAAQSSLPVPKFDEGDIKDIAAPPLPAYPKAASLLRFPTNWSTNETYVDTDTLVIGEDRVVRYSLVIRSAGGAENVTYEGLRCETGERRIYAFGRRDATWSPARNSAWRQIDDSRINRQHFEFWRDVFCDGRVIEPREKLIANIKRGGREREPSIPSE
jgi:CNP1-like family